MNGLITVLVFNNYHNDNNIKRVAPSGSFISVVLWFFSGNYSKPCMKPAPIRNGQKSTYAGV